jgi:dephospho-CoA kinase
MYSWEEYLHMKEYYADNLVVVAVYASPETRYARLAGREIRPLTVQEAGSRDHAEIENMNKGGPIAMADYTLINEAYFEELKAETERIIRRL